MGVLVEAGSNAGFQCIAEARNLLCTLSKLSPEAAARALRVARTPDTGLDPYSMSGHLFAPCPHEKPCPRYENDTIPCNFRSRYGNFDVDVLPKALKDLTFTDHFSYVIFKKGSTAAPDDKQEWHRLVNDPIRNGSKCITCQLCTKDGTLEETYANKKSHRDF